MKDAVDLYYKYDVQMGMSLDAFKDLIEEIKEVSK